MNVLELDNFFKPDIQYTMYYLFGYTILHYISMLYKLNIYYNNRTIINTEHKVLYYIFENFLLDIILLIMVPIIIFHYNNIWWYPLYINLSHMLAYLNSSELYEYRYTNNYYYYEDLCQKIFLKSIIYIGCVFILYVIERSGTIYKICFSLFISFFFFKFIYWLLKPDISNLDQEDPYNFIYLLIYFNYTILSIIMLVTYCCLGKQLVILAINMCAFMSKKLIL